MQNWATGFASTGTPTFFINGVRIDGGLRPEYLDAAIELELKKAGVLND